MICGQLFIFLQARARVKISKLIFVGINRVCYSMGYTRRRSLYTRVKINFYLEFLEGVRKMRRSHPRTVVISLSQYTCDRVTLADFIPPAATRIVIKCFTACCELRFFSLLFNAPRRLEILQRERTLIYQHTR